MSALPTPQHISSSCSRPTAVAGLPSSCTEGLVFQSRDCCHLVQLRRRGRRPGRWPELFSKRVSRKGCVLGFKKFTPIVKLWRGYSTAGENRPWIELLEMRGTVNLSANDATAEHMRRIYTRDSRDFSGAPASGAAVSAVQPTPRLAYETRHATSSEKNATNTERKLLPAV